jgi:hypothetical protein
VCCKSKDITEFYDSVYQKLQYNSMDHCRVVHIKGHYFSANLNVKKLMYERCAVVAETPISGLSASTYLNSYGCINALLASFFLILFDDGYTYSNTTRLLNVSGHLFYRNIRLYKNDTAQI